jgi:hypothetical protein
LAVAGHGNYSYRLYEIMREGRIPVFVNTDCSMPCTEKVDWKKLVLWVEENEVKFIAEKIADFHQSIEPYDFVVWQESIRKAYFAYFTVNGFSDYIIQVMTKLKKNMGKNSFL